MDVNIKIIGLDMFENDIYNKYNKRININDINKNILNIKKNQNNLIIIVIGNEGFGLSNNIKKECDWLAYIKKDEKTPDYIDSLSVNVASSLALYQILSNIK
eukprot:142539_1